MENNCRRIVRNKMCRKEERSHFDCKTSGLAASRREATIHSNYALRDLESQIWIWLLSLTHPFVVNKKKLCLDRRRRSHHSHQLQHAQHIFSRVSRATPSALRILIEYSAARLVCGCTEVERFTKFCQRKEKREMNVDDVGAAATLQMYY